MPYLSRPRHGLRITLKATGLISGRCARCLGRGHVPLPTHAPERQTWAHPTRAATTDPRLTQSASAA